MVMSRYTLETLMGRVPLPRTLIESFDEIFCFGQLLAEWKSVNSGDTLLGERLFGLRRSRRIYIQHNFVRNNNNTTSSASGVRKPRSSLVSALVPLSFRYESTHGLYIIHLLLSSVCNS